MKRMSMPLVRVFKALTALGVASLAVACGSDDAASTNPEGSSKGGSCVTADGCWEVSVPTDYDVARECGWIEGTWSALNCDPSPYARKCTQDIQVSVNNGPEMDVTYVYFWPMDSEFGCLGTEEAL